MKEMKGKSDRTFFALVYKYLECQPKDFGYYPICYRVILNNFMQNDDNVV